MSKMSDRIELSHESIALMFHEDGMRVELHDRLRDGVWRLMEPQTWVAQPL